VTIKHGRRRQTIITPDQNETLIKYLASTEERGKEGGRIAWKISGLKEGSLPGILETA
jgi:hypothetical protein